VTSCYSWQVDGRGDDVWASRQRAWYLIGALRVAQILKGGEGIDRLPRPVQHRVKHNAHVGGRRVESRPLVRVFVGDPRRSARFRRAVDLGVYRADSLLLKTLRDSKGRRLRWKGAPRWSSALRGCRAVLDLDQPEHRDRARLLQQCIRRANPDFSLLAEM
jgi:hypothetical protein